MGTDNIHFTTGQFAKLHNINKRTLHYYDDIGLFSPAYKGKNGYRYYTYQQSPTLEMLLTLRELNMSVNEIDV
ncbi:MAG: MerR family DNA-binding transcriptional regulator, partial [Oscillospiraceae bacterium]